METLNIISGVLLMIGGFGFFLSRIGYCENEMQERRAEIAGLITGALFLTGIGLGIITHACVHIFA